MNKSVVKNVLVVQVILVMATMTACSLVTPSDTDNSVEVVMDGIGGGARGMITDAAWVRINVNKTEGGVQKGSGDLIYIDGKWRGNIRVSETGNMTFTATAGNQDGSTGVYHVSWSGSNDLNVTGGGLSLTIPVSAGDNTRHIFYVNTNSATDGWHYLEVAPSDQSTGIKWYNESYLTTGAIATGIGSGNANTATIVSAQGEGSYAASLCASLVLGGYDNWFLPSKDELNAMYGKKASIGGIASDWYWSSSESNEYPLDSALLLGVFIEGLELSRIPHSVEADRLPVLVNLPRLRIGVVSQRLRVLPSEHLMHQAAEHEGAANVVSGEDWSVE